MSKVFLVTGVSRGIGSAIVEKLCALDTTKVVVGIARSKDKLDDLKAQYDGKFDYVCGDVSDEATVSSAVEFIESQYKRLDGIIANAGVLEPIENVNNLHASKWKRLFDINFFSVVSLVGCTLPLLKQSNGNIIFVSSGASTKAYFGWGAYGSSKAALNHFALTVATEEPAVKVISVAPGVVDTTMQDGIRESHGPGGMSEEALKRFIDLHNSDQLLPPSVPGTIYANLVSRGIPAELNGAYLRYSDEKLKSFAS